MNADCSIGMRFFLGTHQPGWLATAGVALFVSDRRLRGYKTLPRAAVPWALDSGGFTELQKYGRWTATPAEYAARVRRYRDESGGMCWTAPQDWMFTHPSDTCRSCSLIQVERTSGSRSEKLDSGLLRAGTWTLLFYGVRQEWASVDDLLPGVGDVAERARRNGAREGTPFFLDPSFPVRLV
jgi:hypothetical protein